MIYTKAQLMRFNKDELADMADMMGIDIATTDGAEPAKADYAEAIERFAPTEGVPDKSPSAPSATAVPAEPSNVSVRVQRIRDAQAAQSDVVALDLVVPEVEPEPEPAPELEPEPEVEEAIEALNEDGSAVDVYDPETLAHVGSQSIEVEEGSEPEEDFEVEEEAVDDAED